MFKSATESFQYVTSIVNRTLSFHNSSRSNPPITHVPKSQGAVIRDHVLAKMLEGQCACLVHEGKHFEIKACDGYIEGEIFNAYVEDKSGNRTVVPMHPIQKFDGKPQAGLPYGRFLYAELDTQRCVSPQDFKSHIFLKGKVTIQQQ